MGKEREQGKMKEFFNEYFTGNFTRTAEGYMSWQHILVTVLFVGTAIFLAMTLGKKNKNESLDKKIKVIMVAAILIDAFEIIKLTLYCISGHSIGVLLGNLPLFLCSLQLIALPLAAFSKNRLQESMLDFVLIFGLLGGSVGIAAAVHVYEYYPVIHFHTMVSATTHTISLFASLYIIFSRLVSLKKENIWIVSTVFASFVFIAEMTNILQGGRYNYMFLWRSDGTPFIMFENLFTAPSFLYTMSCIILMSLYLVAFYFISYLIMKKSHKQRLEYKV